MAAPLKADTDTKRGWFHSWARPALLWGSALSVPVAAYRGNLEGGQMWALCCLSAFLFAFRGGIDKDGIARILQIWKRP